MFPVVAGAVTLLGVAGASAQTGEIDLSEGGVPYSRVIADPGVPYENLIRNQSIGGHPLTAKVGPGGTGSLSIFPGASLFARPDVPFIHRGFEPGDAFLKVGPFFFDVGPATASVLYSDNANRTETNRVSGVISVLKLNMRALVQWTEGLQFSVAGSFIWLPQEGKAGVEGFGIYDPVGARFDLFGGDIPFAARLTYNFWLSKWEMQFFEQFSAEFANGFFGLRGEFADEIIVTDPVQFDGVDRIGRYQYGSVGQARTYRDGRRTQRFDSGASNLSTDALFLRNIVGLSGTRWVPTDTQMVVTGTRSDNWVLNDSLQVPDWTETGSVGAFNEHENMRFKPFAIYTVRRLSTRKDDIDQIAESGIHGPVTENMDFLGSAGWSKAGGSQEQNIIWTVNLTHDINPLTRQAFSFYRGITDAQLNTDLVTSMSYILTRTLGPYMDGQLFYRRRSFRDLDAVLADLHEWSIGSRLSIDVGPKTDAQLSVVRTKVSEENPANPDYVFLTGTASIVHRYSETFLVRLIYSHDRRRSTTAGDSYIENLVILTAQKRF